MALYEQFPYVNFHELNLADLTSIVKSLQETVDLWNGDIDAAVAAYIADHPEIMITDDSVGTEAIQDGAVTLDKLSPGIGLDYVTPQMFKTDDNTWRDAFQAAFDAGVDVYVPTDAGQVYEIEGPAPEVVEGVTVVRPALVWRNSMPGGRPRKLYGSATWRTVGTAGSIKFKPYNNVQGDEQPLIRVEQEVEGFHIANLRFTTTLKINTGICIDAALSTTIDKDIQITDCSFADFWRVIDFAGRGLNVFNSIFGSCSYVARIRWNHPTTTDESIESRGLWFEGCRFHAITRCVIDVVSGHAWGLMVNGCLLDNRACTFVQSSSSDSAENWMISNNLLQDLNRTSGYVYTVYFRSDAHNCVVHNNLFHTKNQPAGEQSDAPTNIVRFDGAAIGCRITNNTIDKIFYDEPDHTNYRAFTFTDGGSHDILISGNLAINLKPTQYLISTVAGCSRFLIVGNISSGGLREGASLTSSVVENNMTAST